MGTYTLQATKSAILRYNNQTANDHTSKTFQAVNSNDALLIGFEEMPAEAQKEEITAVKLFIRTTGQGFGGTYYKFRAMNLEFSWDESTVNYSAKEAEDFIFHAAGFGLVSSGSSQQSTVEFTPDSFEYFTRYSIANIVSYGIQIYGEGTDLFTDIIFDTAKGSNKPYIEISTTGKPPEIQYVTELTPGASSASSAPYIDKAKETYFKWKTVRTGVSVSGNNLTHFFLWKKQDAESWNEINNVEFDNGNYYKTTIPANTFPAGKIEWKVKAQLGSSTEYSSPYFISTEESIPTAKCEYPKDTLLSMEDTTFAWDYIITSGGNQYAFELQKSTDGTEWTTLVAKTVSTETSTIVPAASLTGGDMYWRVRVYNNDDVASEWSDPAKVLVVAAPAAPGIVITSDAPRFSIRWSAADQQGYEVAVDGVTVLSRYGTVSTYTYDDWLTDGSHTVAVRVQNKYSLWSEWSTAALPILNTPGATIILGAKAAPVPQIRITSNGYDYYVVYRSGKRVAKVKPGILTTFTDNFANGENTYIVRGGYDENGNYGESAEITVTAGYDTLTLYDTVSGKRLRLGNAKRQTRETNLTISRNATLTHYSGAQLPTAETGQQRDRRYQFECAFSTRDERENAEALEAMLGHIVCVCDQYGTALVGIASSARVTVSQFMYSYTVSVDEVDFDEVTANAT